MSDLPPLEEPQAYVVVGPEDQRGPYTLELLIGEVLAGRLSEATPVWWPGLADWTTMGGHPGVAGEISRRRDTSAVSAPGWSDPSASSAAPRPSYEQPSYEQPSYEPAPQSYEQPSQPSYEQPSYEQASQPSYEQSSYEQPSQPSYEQPSTFGTGGYDSQQVVYEQAAGSAPGGFSPAPGDEHGAGTLIDVDSTGAVSWVSDTEGAAGAASAASPSQERSRAFDDLVARSSRRAGEAGRVAAAEQELLSAIVDAAAGDGFVLRSQQLVDGVHQLRFDDGGTELEVGLGRVSDLGAERVVSAVVPFTVTARSGAQGGSAEAVTGAHGDVVVVTDEWTGQTSSAVALHLGLEDYVGGDLSVDRAAVTRDAGAAISAVRARLR